MICYELRVTCFLVIQLEESRLEAADGQRRLEQLLHERGKEKLEKYKLICMHLQVEL
jgi:hypothetical protein